MKAYPKYIESGESWIGAIPEGWRIVRIAKLFSENKIKNSDYEFSHALKFNYGNLIPKGEEGDVSDLKETYIAYTKINKADIAINCLNLNYDFVSQRVAIAKENGIITSAYLILSPRNGVNSEYYNYFFKAMDNRKLFHGMGTGIRLTLSYSELKKHNVCVPSQMEQQTIVLFLNEEIARINDLISEAEKEISLLNELKQAEIAHMVTCGINPNVPMKDSGIAWIGKIPEEWEIKRIAILFSENKNKNTDYEFHRALKFNYGRLIPKNETGDISELKDTYTAYTKIKKNDIAINCLNLNYDFISQRVAIAREDGILTSAYLIMSPRQGVNAEYYNYFFKSMDNKKLFHGMGTGIRLTLSYSELKKQYVIVPPVEEQSAIVAAIEVLNSKVDNLTSQLKKQISCLQELKQRVISDAVTGKIDVRDYKN